MRKLFAAVAALGLVLVGVNASSVDAHAAALGTLDLDCTDGDTLAADIATAFADDTAPFLATNTVISGLIDDTFIIDSDGGTCDVDWRDDASSGGSDGPLNEFSDASNKSVAAVDGDVTFTIANSGTFTITPDSGTAVTITINSCALSGSGIEADPWLVATQANFQSVGKESDTTGENSCSLDGYYLQTAHLSGDEQLDSYNDDLRDSYFAGTYDGDHYNIVIGGTETGGWADPNYAGRTPLFNVVTGTIKKVRLSGTVRTAGGTAVRGTLVHTLTGLVTESRSSVSLEIDPGNDLGRAGGLVSYLDGGRIQYSSYSGQITWDATVTTDNGDAEDDTAERFIGGLVGTAKSTGGEIRDSYARATIEWNNDALADSESAVFAGGGLIGDAETATNTTILRSYATPVFVDNGVADSGTNAAELGGLVGSADESPVLVSTFFLPSSSATSAMGSGATPNDYTSSLPVAVPVDSTELQTLSTFQTEELGSSGNPGGDPIVAAASDESGTASSPDYRWGMEQGSVTTFVASRYDDSGDGVPADDADDFTNRDLFTDTGVAQSYSTRGVTASVSGYPTLGRVWEICSGANNGYPVLVWEEESCGSGSGSGSSEPTQAQEARSLGFTEDEYLRFLDSGLTWEQFTLQLQAEQSAALASTGVAAQRFGLVSAAALGLVIGGLVLLLAVGRRKPGSSAR